MTTIRELPIPPEAQSDERALELVRVWAAKGKQHVSLASGAWSDPVNWGLMLVDLARLISKVYAERQAGTEEQILMRIREGFDAEWDHPTDTPTGKFLE